MSIGLSVSVVMMSLLALSSGVTKIMLMQQEADFYGTYGFTNPILIAFGVAQVVGAVLLMISKTRVYGAAIVGSTFLVSGVVLVLAGNIPGAIVTFVVILVLGVILKLSYKNAFGQKKPVSS